MALQPFSVPLSRFEGDLTNPRSWVNLSRDDTRILQAVIDSGTFAPERVYFNVPVGSPPEPFQGIGPIDPTQTPQRLYFRRIDLVALLGATWWIIEIKPAAGYTAFGQALAYEHLARQQWAELANARPGVITDQPDPDLKSLMDTHEVTIWSLRDAVYTPRGKPG